MSTATASNTVRDHERPQAVSFATAFKYWLKLGFISFGGPAGQIAIMHHDLVERRRWISERRFLHALNYCMVLPGPEAQQLATYIGWLMHGVRGGIAAGVLFVLPSLFLLVALSWIYLAYGDVPAVAGALYGIKPAVIAIVAFAAYRIGTRVLKNSFLWATAAAAFVAIFSLGVPFPYIVAAAGIVGYLGGKILPTRFRSGGHASSAPANYGLALIDDDSVTPMHATFRWSRAFVYAGIGILLWATIEGVLYSLYGWYGTLTQMGWFFTKAALLTFGGAYAVLPYVYDNAVEHYGWLTAAQMIDGLALGETTPGPLIMIVAFVGFVGGATQGIFGPEFPWFAGAVGAVVATFFTFLPSFLFVLVGGPLVEATRDDFAFAAPLTAITAAIVGVIVNLAVFFAYHVLWPSGVSGNVDWFAIAVGIGAFLALWRFKLGVIPVLSACAAAGLVYTFSV